MTKMCAVQIPDGKGGSKMMNISITETTTPRDIKRKLKIPQEVLLAKLADTSHTLANDHPIYDEIANGEKLIASVETDVGTAPPILRKALWLIGKAITVTAMAVFTLLKLAYQHFMERRGAASAAPSVVSRQNQELVLADFVPGATHVDSKAISLWKKRGWKKRGRNLHGFYRTPFGATKGKIENAFSRYRKFYVNNPPKAIKRHSHRHCFRARGGGWSWIHLNNLSPSIDSGIIAVEKIMADCFKSERRSS